MATTPVSPTPDRTVAERIVERFVEAGVLPAQLGDEVITKLASGTLRAEDWRKLAETAIALDEMEDAA